MREPMAWQWRNALSLFRPTHFQVEGSVMTMFEPRNAREEFENVLNGRGLHERHRSLADGFEALFDFYRDIRPQGRVFEQHEDADMLLFQWGTYDWGTGEHFTPT
jgi:hypothetical protein